MGHLVPSFPLYHHESNEKGKVFDAPSLSWIWIWMESNFMVIIGPWWVWSDRELVAHVCRSSSSLWHSPMPCAPHHYAWPGPGSLNKPTHLRLFSCHKCCSGNLTFSVPGGVKICKQMEDPFVLGHVPSPTLLAEWCLIYHMPLFLVHSSPLGSHGKRRSCGLEEEVKHYEILWSDAKYCHKILTQIANNIYTSRPNSNSSFIATNSISSALKKPCMWV